LGTDELGRDVWTRLLYGGRVSLTVGLAAVLLSMTIGVACGAIAGYYGGWVDDGFVRFTEALQCFPRLIIIITLVALVGPSFINLILVMGFLGWTSMFRLVRSQVLSLKEQDFVMAARVVGANGRRIMFRHCLPNSVSPIIVAATFGVAGAILTEAALGFLGLGVTPPQPSWGNMLNAAQGLPYLEGTPWLWVPPVVMISLSVISINLMGDALRDAADPRAMRR
jgi:peptide/nickel transport system permease protein